MVIPNEDGSSGKLYRAIRKEDAVYSLQEQDIRTTSETSNLSLSEEGIAGLRSASIRVIVSSLSGARLALTAYKNILKPLLETLSIDMTVHETNSKTSHCQLIESSAFAPDVENIILIFGGDTMVYDVLNSLAKNPHLTSSHSITLSLVPCGTGNALATSLGITSIPIGISKFFGISTSTPVDSKPLPVMKITVHELENERIIWSTVVCSWGLHASLVADSDAPEMRREFGPKRFSVLPSMVFSSQVAAQRLLTPSPHVYHGAVRVYKTDHIADEHTYLLLSHVSHLEPTFLIAPRQSPLLPSLSLVEVGPMSGKDLMGIMMAVYDNAKHVHMEEVKFRAEVREAEFLVNEDEERWRRICVDGDIVIVPKGSRVNIRVCDGVTLEDGSALVIRCRC